MRGAPLPPEVLKAFVDQHRDPVGVEPICKVLWIAQSYYLRQAAQVRDWKRCCAGAIRDELLRSEIKRVWQANMQAYGADKV